MQYFVRLLKQKKEIQEKYSLVSMKYILNTSFFACFYIDVHFFFKVEQTSKHSSESAIHALFLCSLDYSSGSDAAGCISVSGRSALFQILEDVR